MNRSIKTLEVCRVTPFSDSEKPVSESFLPLTYFDTVWLKFHMIQRVFFYQLDEHESTHTFFNSVLIPKLKRSFSFALAHFLPIAGNIVWPADAAKPFFLYSPNDGVSFILAESNFEFKQFIHEKICEAANVHPYLPELPISDSKASIISFQITLFPNQGFSLGISMHHAMFDGKSVAMFMNSWAHICKKNWKEAMPLPPELTPVFDRTIVRDPEGLDMFNLKNWALRLDPNQKTLKLPRVLVTNFENLMRENFEVSREDVNKLRKNVHMHLNEEDSKHIHLSTFVVLYAYVIVTMVKAKKLDRNGKVGFTFPADCRSRLDPKLPTNYFGNCVKVGVSMIDTEVVLAKHGIASIANEISNMVKLLETRVKNRSTEQENEDIVKFQSIMGVVDMMIAVGGSPRFGIYGTDFRWGKPKKTQVIIVSTDKKLLISMVESRDGNGGTEIGLVLNKSEIEIFNSLFANGLNDM